MSLSPGECTEWRTLASLCEMAGIAAEAAKPTMRDEACFVAPIVVRGTATSRLCREIGKKRRGSPILYPSKSAQSSCRQIKIDSQKVELRQTEKLGAALPGWQPVPPEPLEKKSVKSPSVKGTSKSLALAALASGDDTKEMKRAMGKLNGIGLSIGDRFPSSSSNSPVPICSDTHGSVAHWQSCQSFPARQPCSKYRSANATSIGIDVTRPKYISRNVLRVEATRQSQSALGQVVGVQTKTRPQSAPARSQRNISTSCIRTIAENQKAPGIHDYIQAVMQRYSRPRRGRRGAEFVSYASEGDSLGQTLKEYFETGGVEENDTELLEEAIKDVTMVAHLRKIQFKAFLAHFGIPVDSYGSGKAKHYSDLWVELVTNAARLDVETLPSGEQHLLRTIFVAVAEVFLTEKNPVGAEATSFLLLKHMFLESGAMRKDLNTRVTRKMLLDEDPEESIYRCLEENLSLDPTVCKLCFTIESNRVEEEVKDSEGFPGIKTRYLLNVARVRMRKRCLPTYPEFMTSVGGALKSGSKRIWMWCPQDAFETLFAPKLD